MERREQVFVSSTYVDLVDERQEIIQTLLEANCIPAGMELFPATDDDKWTLIRREIDHSDYYVVVVGGRYGSLDPEIGLSYTEMEFDYAVESGTPVMGFLHGEPGKIEIDKSDIEPELVEKLQAFREKVGKSKVVKFWTTADALGGQVAKSLIKIRQSHPAGGWVRAENALTPEVESELRELRARVRELEAESKLADQRSAVQARGVSRSGGSVDVSYRLVFYTKADRDVPNFRRKKMQLTDEYEVELDQFLRAAGPSLLIEASEVTLREKLSSIILGFIGADDVLPDDYDGTESFFVAEKYLEAVLLRLYSIGVIEESSKRHGVHDKNKYWSLTDSGRERLIALDQTSDANDGSDGGEEPEGATEEDSSEVGADS